MRKASLLRKPLLLLGLLGFFACQNPIRNFDRSIPPPQRRDAAPQKGTSLRLWPLLEYQRGENFTTVDFAWPVYSSEKVGEYRYTSLLWPLLKREKDSQAVHFQLRPLYWYSSGPEEGHHILLPLFYTSYSRQTQKKAYLPFYWDFRTPEYSTYLLMPFYGVHQRGTFQRKFIVPPFYISSYDSAHQSREILILWPMFQYISKGTMRETNLFPLFWYRTLPSEVSTYFLPVFFFTRTEGKTQSILFPLFWHLKEGEEGHLIFFPVWWSYWGAQGKTGVFFPLFWKYSTPERETLSLFPPFYRHVKEGDRAAYRVLWRLLEKEKNSEKSFFAFNPFFSYEEERTGDYSLSFLAGLFRYRVANGEGRFRLFYLLEF